jgi:hypothetical protein
MTKLPIQEKEYMQKTTTIDQGVLEMALVGYEMERSRIEAAIDGIQAQLGSGGSGRSSSTATTTDEPKTPRKKRFSAAARKCMAAAQKKRWAELKAKKAKPAKAKRTAASKRRKATAAAPARKPPVQVKAAKSVSRKVVKAAPKIRIAMVKPQVEEPAPQVQAVVEPAPAEATA